MHTPTNGNSKDHDDDGRGGISDDKEISMCISADHKTTKNLQERKAFTISMGDAAHMAACDYLGIVSGNKEPDKLAKGRIYSNEE